MKVDDVVRIIGFLLIIVPFGVICWFFVIITIYAVWREIKKS